MEYFSKIWFIFLTILKVRENKFLGSEVCAVFQVFFLLSIISSSSAFCKTRLFLQSIENVTPKTAWKYFSWFHFCWRGTRLTIDEPFTWAFNNRCQVFLPTTRNMRIVASRGKGAIIFMAIWQGGEWDVKIV